MKLAKFASTALLFASLLSPALADEYQDVISKAFPGFQILGPSEIKLNKGEMNQVTYERVKDHPGLVVGKFNLDNFTDFAALIRGPVKKQDPRGRTYYDGYLVVCYGLGDGKFDCLKMSPSPRQFSFPFGWYLEKVAPGKYSCHVLMELDTQKRESEGDEKYNANITTRSDSIGYFRTMGNGDIMYVHREKTIFSRCVLSD